MSQDHKASKLLIANNHRRIVKRATRASYSIDSFDKKLQDLQANAITGSYQSQIRFEAISQLLDPCLTFYESDLRRILNKGYSPQVERGLQLYRLMNRLRLFCEPIGEIVGVACRVKLINFEELTLDKLLDIKGQAFMLAGRASDRAKRLGEFNGLDLLTSDEKALYQKLKAHFGGRKRPTLKSLAINLLGEEDEIFSERNVTNYLAAVRDFRIEHKEALKYKWYFVGAIDSYNSKTKTGREAAAAEVLVNFRNSVYLKSLIPQVTIDFGNIFMGISQRLPSEYFTGLKAMVENLPQFVASQNYAAQAIASVAGKINLNEFFPSPQQIWGRAFK